MSYLRFPCTLNLPAAEPVESIRFWQAPSQPTLFSDSPEFAMIPKQEVDDAKQEPPPNQNETEESASPAGKEKTMWEYYNERAAAFDAEQERDWNTNMDVLLIFVRNNRLRSNHIC